MSALAARGLTNEEIAAHTVISPFTAKTHTIRYMIKLGPGTAPNSSCSSTSRGSSHPANRGAGRPRTERNDRPYGTRAVHSSVANFVRTSSSAWVISSAVTPSVASP